VGDAEPLDLAEFAATLVGEVRSGVRASAADAGDELEVTAATIRVGQHREHDEPETSPSVLGLPEGADEVGWEVELTRERDELWWAIAAGDEGGVDAGGRSATADRLWHDRALADLKGVDAVRSRGFEAEGVRSIGELLALEEPRIAEIVQRQRSHRYLDFWVQATLLRTPAPTVGPSAADGTRLSDLAGRSPDELRRRIGAEACSRSAATRLFDLLAAWGTALDRRAMASVTLRELRQATGPPA
jgi:hypothetical protein